jgi:hypothetical protein
LANCSHRNRSNDSYEVDTAVDHFGGEFRQRVQFALVCSKFKADAFPFNPAKVSKSRLEAIHWVGRTGHNHADVLHGAALLEEPGDDDSMQATGVAVAGRLLAHTSPLGWSGAPQGLCAKQR